MEAEQSDDGKKPFRHSKSRWPEVLQKKFVFGYK
jgi:hypothetical protein